MKSLFIYVIFILSWASHSYGQNRDFGAAGLKGLSSGQLADLSDGNIVFLSADTGKAVNKNTLIEAAIVFSATPQTTWNLISKTDDQSKYIDQCKEIKVVNRLPGKAYEVDCVGNWMVTCYYGVIENYLPENNCIYWMLDTSYAKNDLNALNGYWQFYPYSEGKTLARYGSYISLKNVPEFVENMFKKSGVKDALASVKKYVDSGGTYHK